MKRLFMRGLALLAVLASVTALGLAQVTTTGRLTGVVMDQQGAVVGGADVIVRNDATGEEFKVKSGETGTFVVSSLSPGVYSVAVTMGGFKQSVTKNVHVEAAIPATVEVKLEVGASNETVTVTGGAEVLQKETTNVSSTIVGRQITELPFTSRDALDLVMNLPGTSTPGRPRTSSVNGLPKGALNISLDGVNVQDNLLKSSDGFFTYIRPRIDAISEVSVSTATPGAESANEGAVQIKFVTKSGTNEFHGGAYWYHRNPVLNANYYFNNLTGTERARVLLNQFGVSAGGPVTPWLKDKLFFFANYEEFRLPENTVRNRTILGPDAQAGKFVYPGGPSGGVDVLALARANGFIGTFDPTIQKILSDVRASTAAGSVQNQSDPLFQRFTFTNVGGQTRRFPTLRLDSNVTSNHHVELIYNYQDFASKVDFLNGVDPAFPPPVVQILGSQGSNRFSLTAAWRWQINSNVVNEARFGLTGGSVVFFPEVAPSLFDALGKVEPVLPLGLSRVYATDGSEWRNTPIQQYSDTVSWVKGKHAFNFGANFTNVTSWIADTGPLAPQVRFGVPTTDPAIAMFNTSNFPGATTTQLNNAASLYALLTGRINEIDNFVFLDEKTKNFVLSKDPLVQRNREREYGIFFQDFYKFRPNLTLNLGLRYENQLPFVHTNGVYSRPTFEGVFGPSGVNLFKPGLLPGKATSYIPVGEKDNPYNRDNNNFAPSIGIAWNPHFGRGWLKRVFGEDGAVFRGGYSVAYTREGMNFVASTWGGTNPGASLFVGQFADVDFAPGSVLLRNGVPSATIPPPPTYPLPAQIGISPRDFDPQLKLPYVQSWTFGIQRELDKNTVFEARYVGNHSVGLWRRVIINEVNIFENGFLDEFLAAQKNLAISRAAGRGANFSNQGLAGQVNLPIFTASFGSPTSSNFRAATFITRLDQGTAGSVASTLATNTTFHNRRVAAGLPANLFVANPSTFASPRIVQNGGSSTYNGLQLELRRRLSSGLLVQGSYTFSKSLSNMFASSSTGDSQPHTLRNYGLDKGPSPWDIRHSFKVNYIYELPFGHGHRLDYRGPGNVIGKFIEGWQTDGILRWQSGRVFNLTSGRATFNQNDSGVELVGMSVKELQDMVKIRKDPLASTRGTVFWLPQDIIDNSLKAFGLLPGTPTGKYIAPPSTPGKFGSFVFLHGPSFFRADLSMIKKTRITERVNMEFRAEFLNAFNNINFFVGSVASDVTGQGVNTLTFGQTASAYQDLSTTNDPGGRLIQFVLRFSY